MTCALASPEVEPQAFRSPEQRGHSKSRPPPCCRESSSAPLPASVAIRRQLCGVRLPSLIVGVVSLHDVRQLSCSSEQELGVSGRVSMIAATVRCILSMVPRSPVALLQQATLSRTSGRLWPLGICAHPPAAAGSHTTNPPGGPIAGNGCRDCRNGRALSVMLGCRSIGRAEGIFRT